MQETLIWAEAVRGISHEATMTHSHWVVSASCRMIHEYLEEGSWLPQAGWQKKACTSYHSCWVLLPTCGEAGYPPKDRGATLLLSCRAGGPGGSCTGPAGVHLLWMPRVLALAALWVSPVVTPHALGKPWLSLFMCMQPTHPSVHGDRDRSEWQPFLFTLPLLHRWVSDEPRTVWGWLPLFPGGPTCLLVSHLALPAGQAQTWPYPHRRTVLLQLGTPCSMTPDWHPTWRENIWRQEWGTDAQTDQGQGWSAWEASDWGCCWLDTRRGEERRKDERQLLRKGTREVPTSAKKNPKTKPQTHFAHISFNLPRVSSSILTSPHHHPATPRFWLLIFTKESVWGLGRAETCSLVWLCCTLC